MAVFDANIETICLAVIQIANKYLNALGNGISIVEALSR